MLNGGCSGSVDDVWLTAEKATALLIVCARRAALLVVVLYGVDTLACFVFTGRGDVLVLELLITAGGGNGSTGAR